MDLQCSIKEIIYERMSKTMTAVVSNVRAQYTKSDITSAKEVA